MNIVFSIDWTSFALGAMVVLLLSNLGSLIKTYYLKKRSEAMVKEAESKLAGLQAKLKAKEVELMKQLSCKKEIK